MTDLTDRVLSDILREEPNRLHVYHHDATYHAEWHLLRQALDRAHTALMDRGESQAEDIIKILAKGLPDPHAAAQRIEDHRERTRELMHQPGLQP